MEDLDDLFATARASAMQPSDVLMARVLADAAAAQARPVAQTVAPVRLGFWAGLTALFGGSGVLAGVGSAALAGLVLGFVQPVGLMNLTDVLAGTTVDTLELMPGVDALLAEE